MRVVSAGAGVVMATTGMNKLLPGSGVQVSVLIDSNVFIAAEDHGVGEHAFGAEASELLRLAGLLHFPVMISAGTRSDIARSGDRRESRGRQLEKYQVLAALAPDQALAARAGFPPAPGPNDEADLEVLTTFATGVATWLVTNDERLRRRAFKAGYRERVFSIGGALDLLRQLLAQPAEIPAVETVKAYEVGRGATLLAGLRDSYPPGPGDPGWDSWWAKVCQEQRECLVIGQLQAPEALAVLKIETEGRYGLPPRVLKICTFKVADGFNGTRRGELLLKGVIDFARRNKLDVVYLEASSDTGFLPAWLDGFGFSVLDGASTIRGEAVFVKALAPPPGVVQLGSLEHNIAYGPGALRIERAHLVPIRDGWHRRLLPEVPDERQALFPLPLEPCGNAIRKAYLCRANTRKVLPGDALLFLRTGAGPSHVTAIGVTESTLTSSAPEEIVRTVGGRTVYSVQEIQSMCRKGNLLCILFRLDRIVAPPWPANTVLSNGLVGGVPQSIAQVQSGGVEWLVRQLDG